MSTSNESATPAATTAAPVMLQSAEDWHRWYSVLRTNAINRDVWDYVNPDSTTPMPTLPDVPNLEDQIKTLLPEDSQADPVPSSLSPLDKEIALMRFDREKELVKRKTRLVEQQKRSLIELDEQLHRTAGKYITLIESATTLRERIKQLRATLSINTASKKEEFMDQFEAIKIGPKNTKVSQWLDHWDVLMTRGQELDLYFMKDGVAYRAFLEAIKHLDAAWASAYLKDLRKESRQAPLTPVHELPGVLTPLELSRAFRVEYKPTRTSSRSAFAATLQGVTPGKDKKSDRRAGGSRDETCLDGTAGHSEASCYLLNKEKRPQNIRLSTRHAKTLVEALGKNAGLKEKYKAVLPELKTLAKNAPAPKDKDTEATEKRTAASAYAGLYGQPSATDTDNAASGSLVPRLPTAETPPSAFSADPTYTLRDSTILDGGATMHIVNNKDLLVQGSFTPYEDHLHSGYGVRIRGFGKRLLPIDTPDGSALFSLSQVAYVPGFPVNVVSAETLLEHGYTHDQLSNEIREGDQVICFLQKRYRQNLFQYRPIQPLAAVAMADTDYPPSSGQLETATVPNAAFPVSSRLPKPPRDADARLWHLRCGHLGKEALERLMSHSYGVRTRGQIKLECQACAQADAKRVPSRRGPSSPARRPFERIFVDLFQFDTSYDGHNRVLLIQDQFTGLTWVKRLVGKTQAELMTALKEFEAYIWQQFELKTKKVRRDNEKGLAGDFDSWIIDTGVEDEPTPPYTSAPNGGSERSGGVIARKATSMRLGARLPRNLWPEVWDSASYIHNRTPRAKNNWVSPREKLNVWLRQEGKPVNDIHDAPDLSNLYAYGCRAYPLTDEALKQQDRVVQKNSARAHLGYLVGYEASDVFMVWVPSKGTVRRVRDVTVKEDTFFDLSDQDLSTEDIAEYHLSAPQGIDISLPSSSATNHAQEEEESASDTDSEREQEDVVRLGTPIHSSDDEEARSSRYVRIISHGQPRLR